MSKEEITNNDDDSIIDITGQSLLITINSQPIKLKHYEKNVPFWEHHYVYSHEEINDASEEQKNFYADFKIRFLNGEYIDLYGNTNYSFILLFDLLNEFNIHRNFQKLEEQLKSLGKYYPRTKSYCVSHLIKIVETNGDYGAISRINEEFGYQNPNYNSFYEYWKIGTNYKYKLNLTDEEEQFLNSIWYSFNQFSSIDYCFIQILKLYLSLIKELKSIYQSQGSNINNKFFEVAENIALKQYNFKSGRINYKECVAKNIKEFYLYILKSVENAIRFHYGHNRKINTDLNYTHKEVIEEFELKINSNVKFLISNLINNVTPPDIKTEIELNTQNTNRWKITFDKIIKNFNLQPKEFYDAVFSLCKLNKNNPNLKKIFFEASKFIAEYDKIISLNLFVYYIYCDIKSQRIENKRLAKSIQKILFKSEEQIKGFEKILIELIDDKKIKKALNKIPKIYEIKRKKIQLDTKAINEAQIQHSGTVELLNEYLKDDFEVEDELTQVNEKTKNEVVINEESNIHNTPSTNFIAELRFTPIQIITLEFFLANELSVTQSELELFAKSKGVFKNQLVESINDICYEHLDDLLIEEDDNYTINSDYFQRITIK